MNYYALLPLVAVFANIALGFYITYRGTHEKLNKLYIMVTIGLVIWAFSNFMAFSGSTEQASLLWLKTTTIGSTLAVTSLTWFILLFIRNKFVTKTRNIILLYIPAIVLSTLAVFTSLSVSSVDSAYWGYRSIQGPVSTIVSSYLIALTIVILRLCYIFYKKNPPQKETHVAQPVQAPLSQPCHTLSV